MRKQTIYLMLAVSASLTFSQCKKYDQGPSLSLRSKKERVSNEWNVASYTYNQKDQLKETYSGYHQCISSNQILYTEIFRTTTYVWTFDKSGTWNYKWISEHVNLNQLSTYNNCYAFYLPIQINTEDEAGTWKFVKDKEEIEISYNTGQPSESYKIKELKENEMILEYTDIYGKISKITFKASK